MSCWSRFPGEARLITQGQRQGSNAGCWPQGPAGRAQHGSENLGGAGAGKEGGRGAPGSAPTAQPGCGVQRRLLGAAAQSPRSRASRRHRLLSPLSRPAEGASRQERVRAPLPPPALPRASLHGDAHRGNICPWRHLRCPSERQNPVLDFPTPVCQGAERSFYFTLCRRRSFPPRISPKARRALASH